MLNMVPVGSTRKPSPVVNGSRTGVWHNVLLTHHGNPSYLGAVTCLMRGTPSSDCLALQITRPARALCVNDVLCGEV